MDPVETFIFTYPLNRRRPVTTAARLQRASPFILRDRVT
jgi:hypothetical protein